VRAGVGELLQYGQPVGTDNKALVTDDLSANERIHRVQSTQARANRLLDGLVERQRRDREDS
jgi:hypothetical protein